MLGQKCWGFGVALVFCCALTACGKDQREHPADSRGAGDGDGLSGGDGDGDGPSGGDGNGDGDGDGDGSSEPLELVQEFHVELFKKELAGASCGVQVGDALLVASSLGDYNYLTRTSLPFDDLAVSEITDFIAHSDTPMETCEAHLAGDRFFVLFRRYEEQSDAHGDIVVPVLVSRGFAVDLEGRLVEEDLGAAEEFLDPELVAAAGRHGQLGLLGWENSDSHEIYFKLFEEGQELPSPDSPIAECQVNDVPPTLVATSSGFAAAFVCVSPEEAASETSIVLAFIQGQEVRVARFEISGQRSEFPIALFPHADGSVIWAYGAAEQDADEAEVAMIHRFYPTAEFGYEGPVAGLPTDRTVGQIALPNQGLRLAPRAEGGLVLIAPGERWGEDRPPDRFFDYCFLDETGVPIDECFRRQGNNLHAFPSGLYALDGHSYAPLVDFTPWDAPDVANERVLFDARNDVPRALYCSKGQCEVAQQSYSNSAHSFGYMGYSFLDVAGIFSDNVGWARHQPVSYVTGSGSFGEVPPLVHGWTGGSVEVISLGQGPMGELVGPLLLSIDRGSSEVLSSAGDLSWFNHGDIWKEADGYRVFRSGIEEPYTGLVNAAGELESQLADVPYLGEIHRCGERFLSVPALDQLFLSTNDAATEFEQIAADDPSYFKVLGCTDRFLARWMMYGDAPLQIILLESGEVMNVPGFERGEVPLAGSMGERLALFRLGSEDVEMTLVDAAGAAELHHLPVPESFDDDAPEGWGGERLLVPEVLDDDLSHVSAIWVAQGGAVYLSSWRYSTEPWTPPDY